MRRDSSGFQLQWEAASQSGVMPKGWSFKQTGSNQETGDAPALRGNSKTEETQWGRFGMVYSGESFAGYGSVWMVC
jgi:hypothetical protein